MRTKWILWLGTFLLLTWAVLTTASMDAANATALSGIRDVLRPRWLMSLTLWTVSLASFAGMWRNKVDRWELFVLTSQQGLLFLAAYASLAAVLRSEYADGVPRPQAFMLADQVPAILGFILHTFAILELGGVRLWTPRRLLSFSRWRSRA